MKWTNGRKEKRLNFEYRTSAACTTIIIVVKGRKMWISFLSFFYYFVFTILHSLLFSLSLARFLIYLFIHSIAMYFVRLFFFSLSSRLWQQHSTAKAKWLQGNFYSLFYEQLFGCHPIFARNLWLLIGKLYGQNLFFHVGKRFSPSFVCCSLATPHTKAKEEKNYSIWLSPSTLSRGTKRRQRRRCGNCDMRYNVCNMCNTSWHYQELCITHRIFSIFFSLSLTLLSLAAAALAWLKWKCGKIQQHSSNKNIEHTPKKKLCLPAVLANASELASEWEERKQDEATVIPHGTNVKFRTMIMRSILPLSSHRSKCTSLLSINHSLAHSIYRLW